MAFQTGRRTWPGRAADVMDETSRMSIREPGFAFRLSIRGDEYGRLAAAARCLQRNSG